MEKNHRYDEENYFYEKALEISLELKITLVLKIYILFFYYK